VLRGVLSEHAGQDLGDQGKSRDRTTAGPFGRGLGAIPLPVATERKVTSVVPADTTRYGFYPAMNHRKNMIALTTPDAPRRTDVERAPHPHKLVLYLCRCSKNAVALAAPDDGKVVSILRDVHEDGSAGHAFELAADVFAWHRAQPCHAAIYSCRPICDTDQNISRKFLAGIR
jgi:hypothetical protein